MSKLRTVKQGWLFFAHYYTMLIWPIGDPKWQMLDKRFPDSSPRQLRFILRTPVKPFPRLVLSRLSEEERPQNTHDAQVSAGTQPPLSVNRLKPSKWDVAKNSDEGMEQQGLVQGFPQPSPSEPSPSAFTEPAQSTSEGVQSESSHAPQSSFTRKASLPSTDPRLRGRLHRQTTSADQSPISSSPMSNLASNLASVPFEELKSKMVEALAKDSSQAVQHLKNYFGIDWNDMIPHIENQAGREEVEVMVFVHYPEALKEEKTMLTKILASLNVKRYDSGQAREWKYFSENIHAGVILVRIVLFILLLRAIQSLSKRSISEPESLHIDDSELRLVLELSLGSSSASSVFIGVEEGRPFSQV